MPTWYDTTTRYRVERLPNGFIRVDDRVSGLTGLYNPDGTYRSGDLRRAEDAVARTFLKETS